MNSFQSTSLLTYLFDSEIYVAQGQEPSQANVSPSAALPNKEQKQNKLLIQNYYFQV